MKRIREWVHRAAGLFNRAGRDRELADEIESHLQLHTDEFVRQGMTPDAARRAAVLRLGSMESLKDRYRDQHGVPLVDHIGQDLRYAARVLRRSPGFTTVALVTIALGVAGPTVMFSMSKAWILDPLPFTNPEALIDVRRFDSETGNTGALNAADFLDWRRTARSVDALAGYRNAELRMNDGPRAERLRAADVTADFFTVLDARAQLGRLFAASDEVDGRSAITVISHALWRDHFGSDAAIVGRTIRLAADDYTIVGVLPDGFQFTLLGDVNVWRVVKFTPQDEANRRVRSLVGVARLRQGQTIAQAREELVGLARDLSAKYPDTNAKRSVRVIGLADEIRRHHDLGFLVPVLFAMVGCVLLIACVNVTNVMLARASTRRQEMAVRLALGASRGRIVRQWLVEHVVLFVAASAIGATLAVYGTSWITNAIPADNRQYLRNHGVLTVDRGVLLFALGVGALCGAIFGWVPAWTGSQADFNADLRDTSARATAGTTGTRLRSGLVVAEVALALALLVGAALLVQTSRNISRVDVGFDPHRLLTFELSLDEGQYRTDAAIRSFYERLTTELANRPGVISAGAGSLVPFGTEGRRIELFIDGQPDPTPSDTPLTSFSQITPDYPVALRLRLAHGRPLNASDDAVSPRVAVINETLAGRFFSGRDPIGQRIRLGRSTPDVWTVVGLVRDVKNFETVDTPEPQVYVPFAQWPASHMTVVVRSNGPDALAETVRSTVAALDPAEPVSGILTMDARIRRVTGPFEITATFVSFFGAVTLLLAAVGVYGLISYTVAQRTREIGIRMALGAGRADVAWLVLSQVRTFLLAGLVPGLALAWMLGQAMQAILVGVTATDWRLYASMSALLAAVALAAAAVPARRAAIVNPIRALRCD
jgi:predicted permease